MRRNTWRILAASGIFAVASMLPMTASAQFNGQQQQGNGQGGFQQGQQGQGGFGGQGQGQGGRGQFDPASVRQGLTARYKDALNASDEEWAVLGPKIDRIQTLQTDLGGGMTGAISLMMRQFAGANRGGPGGPGGPGGGGGGQFGGQQGNRPPIDLSAILGPETPIRRKMTTLQALLDNPNSSAAEIKQVMASIRDDRERGRIELAKARKDLIDLLTPRQEGVLFQAGLLE